MKEVNLVTKSVEVTKEAAELADSLVGIVKSGREALKDGFQASSDIPKIVTDNLMNLMSGLEGMDKLGKEAEANKTAFIAAWTLAGLEIAELYMASEK